MNSREKGKRGERAWRDELLANGYAARRGQQFSGSPESPDVVCPALPWIHFEVKAVERLNIEEAMEQARVDARESGNRESGNRETKIPVVAHRRSFRPWLVTMEAETFFRMVRGDFNHGVRGIRGSASAQPTGGLAPGDNVPPFVEVNLAGASMPSDNRKEEQIRKENQKHESSS